MPKLLHSSPGPDGVTIFFYEGPEEPGDFRAKLAAGMVLARESAEAFCLDSASDHLPDLYVVLGDSSNMGLLLHKATTSQGVPVVILTDMKDFLRCATCLPLELNQHELLEVVEEVDLYRK